MNKLMIAFIGSIAILSLSGCGQVDRTMAKLTGEPTAVCYKGVEYVQFTSGASVAYNTDGTIKLCQK